LRPGGREGDCEQPERSDIVVEPPRKRGRVITDDEINAALARKNIDPDRLLSRPDVERLLASFGIALSAKTQAKNAALGRPGVPYRIICGRALASPRDALRWAFDRPVRTTSFDTSREGRMTA
jgi:hypothetical protein